MRSAFKLGSVAGIEISVHFTWIFAFLLIVWSLAMGAFPQTFDGWSTTELWVAAAISVLLLFVSVLVHEVSHSLVARARGLPVQGITLFIFGGVSRIGGEAKTALDEFMIAFIGPLTSLVIGGVLLVIWALTLAPAALADSSPAAGVFMYVAVMNLAVGVFNLLPGFPLDGGRVLRAAVWGVTGNEVRALKIAASAGQVVAMLMIGYGVYMVLTDNFLGGLWIAFIGWFLYGAADSSVQERVTMNIASRSRVRDIMLFDPPVIGPTASVDDLVQDYIIRRGVRAAPVVEDGRLAGIISLSDVRRLEPGRWRETPVQAVMTRPPLQTITPDAGLDEALRLLAEHEINQAIVVENGRLAGMVTREGLLRFLRIRQLQDAEEEPAEVRPAA